MRKSARIGVNSPAASVVNVWKREVGDLSTRNFAHRFAASEDLVLRLDIFRKLEKHRGCVNAVSFNAVGDIVVTGSDDRKVIFWDWESGNVKLSFHSGHYNNVFQAKIMPYSDDRSIVTCAADGQVRHAQILESGKVETKILTKHQARAHKLAIEPGSPHIFYTCGEDGLVQHVDLRTQTATKLFTCQPLWDRGFMSVINLNAIAIDPRNPNMFSVAGADEFARLFDIRKYNWSGSPEFGQPIDFFCPAHLLGDEHMGITGLAYSDQSELLVSYADESIYLFSKDMGLGPYPELPSPLSSDCDSNAPEMGWNRLGVSSPREGDANVVAGPQVFEGHLNRETVKGVNFFGPKCEYVMSGSDCGRIFIWKKKGGELIRVMEADKHVVNCIEAHPHITVLASSGIESDIKIWTPKALERATLPTKLEKVPIPRRIRYFPLDGFDEVAEYLYFAGSIDDEETYGNNSDDNNSYDDEDSEDFFDEDDDNDDDDEDDCESMDEDGDEEEGDEDFYDSVVNDDNDNDSSHNEDDVIDVDSSLDD